MRDSQFRRWLGVIAIVLVLAGALALLGRELRGYHYRQVADALSSISRQRIAVALLLAAVAYVILPAYDALGLEYAGARLSLRRITFSALIAYGISQTLGFPMLTAGAVRYRFWSAWGLTIQQMARAASFVGATFTIGLVAISGVALLLEPDDRLAALGISVMLCRVFGAVLLAVIVAYLAWSILEHRPIRIGQWTFPVPRPFLAFAQLGAAVADWIACGAVMYVLVPPGTDMGFLVFLGLFLLSQSAAFVSHVPGGVGVFDTLMVVFMRPQVPPDQTLAMLLAFRVIYYLLPFGLAVAALGAYELHASRPALASAAPPTANLGFVMGLRRLLRARDKSTTPT